MEGASIECNDSNDSFPIDCSGDISDGLFI